MRALIPTRLLVVGETIWAVDAVQPVAAILDPAGGRSPRLVSWGDLPPAPTTAEWGRSLAVHGESVYVQEHPGGPVARLGEDGIEQVWWANGRRLAAAGPDGAWLVSDDETWAEALSELGMDDLDVGFGADPELMDAAAGIPEISAIARCGPEGVRGVLVEGRVLSLRSGPEGLDVEIQAGAAVSGYLRAAALDFDGDPYEDDVPTTWRRLPWGDTTIEQLGPEQDIPEVRVAPYAREDLVSVPDIRQGPWWQEPLVHAGYRWRAGVVTDDVEDVDPGEDPDPGAGWEEEFEALDGPGGIGDVAGLPGPLDLPAGFDAEFDAGLDLEGDDWSFPGPSHVADDLAVVAHRADGSFAARWDVGAGAALSLVQAGDGVAVAVDRGRPRAMRPGPAEVLIVRSGGDTDVQVLLPRDLDITEHCRPLVPRPVEADSYAAQMLTHLTPPDSGVEDASSALVGEWPHTCVEWTFTHPVRPGLRLRRRLALYDEMGRLVDDGRAGGVSLLEQADLLLLDALSEGVVPPAEDAVDGILDV